MEIGVIAQRFRLPFADAIAIAAITGVSGVQLYSRTPFEDLLLYSEKERRQAREYIESFGLKTFSICGEVGGFGFREKAENPAKIERTKRNIDLALDFGCNIVTSHIGVIRREADSPLRQAQLASLREIGAYAASRGAMFAIETGPERGAVLRELLDEAAAPGVGVNLDPGNMVMVTGEPPQETVAALAPYIVHTHIKDGRHFRDCDPEMIYRAFATGGIQQLIAETGKLFVETEAGKGDVDWDKYLASLRRIGFDGALVIERENTQRSFEEVCETVKFIRDRLNK